LFWWIGGSRVLGTFDEEISDAAKRRLERLGVEVRLGKAVDKIDADGITAGGERIASKTVIWTAGVAPSPAGKWLGGGNGSRGPSQGAA
jgi:NADH dehydrogenase FAD-containing subunit